MYKDRFVACIKSNGKLLKEFENTVYLPFNSEYQIYMKNLNSEHSVRVDIAIDEQNITQNALVINPLQQLTLFRSVPENQIFKFTKNIETLETQGGSIVISFCYEISMLALIHSAKLKSYETLNYTVRDSVVPLDVSIIDDDVFNEITASHSFSHYETLFELTNRQQILFQLQGHL